MMYLYIAIALLVGLLLGKALFGKKAAPAPAPAPVAAVPAAPQEDEDEIVAVIADIAAMMGCAPEQVRILSLREDSPWRPTLLISDGGQEYNLYGVAVFTTYFIARRALFEELTIRNAGYRMK